MTDRKDTMPSKPEQKPPPETKGFVHPPPPPQTAPQPKKD